MFLQLAGPMLSSFRDDLTDEMTRRSSAKTIGFVGSLSSTQKPACERIESKRPLPARLASKVRLAPSLPEDVALARLLAQAAEEPETGIVEVLCLLYLFEGVGGTATTL